MKGSSAIDLNLKQVHGGGYVFFQKCVKQQDFIFQNQIQTPLKIIIPLINTILENTIQVGISLAPSGAHKDTSLQLSSMVKEIGQYAQSFHITEI